MSKSSLRFLLYYLAARVILALLTTYIFPEMGVWGFLQEYRRYVIIVSVSYFFYGYFIDEEEKKFFYIRNLLLYGNVYLALHIFLRPLLNIEPALFLLLACIVVGIRYVSQLHIKGKRIFYRFWGSISFLILISGFFYLYPDAPDISGFYSKQKTLLITKSPTALIKQTAYITISNTQRTFDQLFEAWTQHMNLVDTSKISYISSAAENDAQLFVLFPDASLLQIFPQSSVKIEEEVVLENWKLSRFRAPRTGLLDGLYRNTHIDRTVPSLMNEETYQEIASFYRADLQKYLTRQIGSDFLASPTLQWVNKSVLTFLSKIFPGFFSQNLKNYYQFAYYFTLFTPQELIITTDKYAISESSEASPSLFQQLKNNSSLPSLRVF